MDSYLKLLENYFCQISNDEFLAKPVKVKTKDLRVYKKKKLKLMKILEIKLLFKIIFENLENLKMTISRWDQPKYKIARYILINRWSNGARISYLCRVVYLVLRYISSNRKKYSFYDTKSIPILPFRIVNKGLAFIFIAIFFGSWFQVLQNVFLKVDF